MSKRKQLEDFHDRFTYEMYLDNIFNLLLQAQKMLFNYEFEFDEDAEFYNKEILDFLVKIDKALKDEN